MYNLVIGRNTLELSLKVNDKIREGFMPLGGPVMIEGDLLVQAVFKNKSDKESK